MTPAILKKVEIHEKRKLQQLSRKAYYLNYFDHWNSKAGIESYLHDQFGEERLHRDLTNENIAYHFIHHQNHLVGFSKLNFNPEQQSLFAYCELEKLYLLPAFIGKGLGRLALEENLFLAQKKQKKGVYLYVIETNRKAQYLYHQFGFEVEEKTRFLIPDFKDEYRGLLKMKMQFSAYNSPPRALTTFR